MSLKAHARHSLGLSRRIMEGIIDSLKSDDDWFYQPHDKANHALWIIGHLGLADNMFASRFRENRANEPAGYKDLFWFGSEPSADRSRYPPVEEVLAYFRERRETLLKVLDELTEEELSAAAPGADEGGPMAGAPSMGHAFHFVAYHEGVHNGQLTVCHRGLGNPPLFRPGNVPAGEGA